MGRNFGIQESDFWIYIDDDDTVKRLPPGQEEPPGGGSSFKVVLVPDEMLMEVALSADSKTGASQTARMMVALLHHSIGDWKGVGKPAVPFAGPESVQRLDPEAKNLLASWLFDRMIQRASQRKNGRRRSGNTRSARRSSGGGGTASKAARRATRSK